MKGEENKVAHNCSAEKVAHNCPDLFIIFLGLAIFLEKHSIYIYIYIIFYLDLKKRSMFFNLVCSSFWGSSGPACNKTRFLKTRFAHSFSHSAGQAAQRGQGEALGEPGRAWGGLEELGRAAREPWPGC